MPTPGFKLVEAGGVEVPLGTIIHDFRGKQWKLHNWYIRTGSASNGKVCVASVDHEAVLVTEFYPSVFNLTILPKDPQP